MQNKYLKSIEENYLKNQKEKIMDFSRELISKNEITPSKLIDTYFELYVKKRIITKK